jgi:hypothetical protein
MQCRHCNRRKVHRPRGLCIVCYYTPEILALYPSTSKFAPGKPEPTEAELDAMIATQMQCLPDWWGEESRREGNP